MLRTFRSLSFFQGTHYDCIVLLSGTSKGSTLQKPDLTLLDFAALEEDSDPEVD